MRIGWGLKVKESACHGIEPELPQDGVETVQVRKVSALDVAAQDWRREGEEGARQ